MNPHRIHILDILRGFALAGILAANIPAIAWLPWPAAGESGRAVYDFIELAVDQRFFPIFCFLFGVGFYIFMRNVQEKGASPCWTMVRRLGLLAVFGALHAFLQPGEALLPYAIAGFVVLPLYKLSPRGLLIATGVFLVLFGVTMTEIFIIPAMFCFGLFISKIGYFENRDKFRDATRITWMASLALIGPAVWAQVNIIVPVWPSPLATLTGLVIAVAMTTSILLLQRAETILGWLAPFGRMALTNYILQSVVVHVIARANPGITYAAIPGIWLAVLSAQIPLSAWWLRNFEYGPLEWLWRTGTFLRLPCLTRSANQTAQLPNVITSSSA